MLVLARANPSERRGRKATGLRTKVYGSRAAGTHREKGVNVREEALYFCSSCRSNLWLHSIAGVRERHPFEW